MREGAQLTYEAAIWEVMQAYPDNFQQDMLEPMEPGMVSHTADGHVARRTRFLPFL